MRRGEFYRVQHPTSHDPKRQRVFVIVSRQMVLDSKLSTIICAPVYSSYDGLSTQVPVGTEEGLKQDSSIHCDELVSLLKTRLTYYVGFLSSKKMQMLDRSLKVALHLDQE